MQAFLSGAVKLHAERLGHALKAKLQYHSWQVRLKAVRMGEALFWQRGSSKMFGTVGEMFGEDAGPFWMWLIATSFVEGKFQGCGPAWPGQSQREWEASRNLRLHQVTSPGSEILRLESNFSPLHLYFLWGLMRRRYCLWFSLNCWWKSCHWVVCNWCWKFIVGRYPLFLSYSISLALFNIMLVLGHLYLLSELNQHNSF
jgi:hypothetical protein